MTRNSHSKILQQPDYLRKFEYKTEPKLGLKYQAVKNGTYDLENEEM